MRGLVNTRGELNTEASEVICHFLSPTFVLVFLSFSLSFLPRLHGLRGSHKQNNCCLEKVSQLVWLCMHCKCTKYCNEQWIGISKSPVIAQSQTDTTSLKRVLHSIYSSRSQHVLNQHSISLSVYKIYLCPCKTDNLPT